MFCPVPSSLCSHLFALRSEPLNARTKITKKLLTIKDESEKSIFLQTNNKYMYTQKKNYLKREGIPQQGVVPSAIKDFDLKI